MMRPCFRPLTRPCTQPPQCASTPRSGAGLPELRPQQPDTVYPLSISVPMFGMVLLNTAVFAVVCWQSFRFWRWILSLFGPLQPFVLAAAAAYLAVSIWLYSQPINALQWQAQQRRPAGLAQSKANQTTLEKKEG